MTFKISVLLILFTNSLHLCAKQFPFTGDGVEIVGVFAALNVTEGISGEIGIEYAGSIQGNTTYEIMPEDNLTIINLKNKGMYTITVPKGTTVSCNPVEISNEETWYKEQNNNRIFLKKLNGEVIVNADGYDIELIDVMGPTSIVTYGDIRATYNTAPTSDLISLDTYLGSIIVSIPEPAQSNIDATAKNGQVVYFNENVKFHVDSKNPVIRGQRISSEQKIKLHSENGDFVRIQSVVDPTHPDVAANKDQKSTSSNFNKGSQVLTSVFDLYQNSPNPFEKSTVIGFNLPEESAAKLTIFNVAGEAVWTIRDTYAKGYNEITLTKAQLGVTGVLYYELESGDKVTTRKMVVNE